MIPQTDTLNFTRTKSVGKAIFYTGTICGFLDGVAAVLYYLISGGKNPVMIFNFIASGVFGRAAFSGGLPMAFLGLLFHFAIATVWTAVFYLAYPKINFVQKNTVIGGIVYGVLVWIIMNMVILPLSRVPAMPFDVAKAIVNILILVLAIGLPVSIMANRFYTQKLSR
jgi:hypothetical protein